MADPRVTIDELPEQVVPDGYTIVSVAGVTRKLSAISLVTETAATNHIADTTDAHAGTAISASPGTNLTANNVDGQLDQTDVAISSIKERLDDLEAGGGDASLGDHINDTDDAHDATAISFQPSEANPATNVQAAIAEVVTIGNDNLLGHKSTPDAHPASNITFAPTGSIAATDVQQAIVEATTDGQAALTAHGSSATAHPASSVTFSPVGTIAATNVQAAIAEMLAELPGATTPIAWATATLINGYTGTLNYTKIATTVFVQGVIANGPSSGLDGSVFITTLPVGFRPIAGNAVCGLTYKPTGSGLVGISVNSSGNFFITTTALGPQSQYFSFHYPTA